MRIKEYLELLTLAAPFSIFIWWAAHEKFLLKEEIDKNKDYFEKIYSQIDKRLDLHIQASNAAKTAFNERLSGQDKRFTAKFERIESKIEKIEGKLDKQD